MNNYNNGQYYNNGYQTQSKPLSYYIKNFLLAFLFVVIFLFLLLWLLPNKASINPLSDQIFQNNLTGMKDVTTSYYTKDRLPQNEGESKKLTLQEMIDMKLLLNVTDKKGKACNTNESYSEITKLKNEYKLKVNLKCGNTEDYIVTYLGCYKYCDDDSVCEKQKDNDDDEDGDSSRKNQNKNVAYNNNSSNGNYNRGTSYSNNNGYYKNKVVKKSKQPKQTKKVINKTINITTITKTIINKITTITIVITPDKPTPKPEKHYCEVIDGTYYDKNGNVVSPSEYEESCGEPAKHYCEIVDGKYYDKNGNVVNGDEYERSCKETPEKHYCEVIEGTYYDKNGNVVSPSEYEESCGEPEKHYCEIVDGKYYDKNGNIVNGDEYERSCKETPEPEKHYCEVIEGTYYDKNGNVVSPSEYKESCVEPEKHYCEIVDGKYYDKDGNIVNGDEYEESCKEEPEKHYCEVIDGKYYDKDGNVVSKSDYEKSCNPEPEKHYCEIIDGKYYDKDGNIVSQEDYERSCNPEEDKYRYQYEKTCRTCHDKQYSEWSDWSEDKEYDPNNNTIPWGQNEYTWYEKNGYKVTKYYEYTEDRSKPIYNISYDKLLGHKTQYACEGYTYFIDSTTSTVYTTSTSATGWVYQSTQTMSSVPESTLTKKYVVVGIDYDKCEKTCSMNPKYKVEIYTRTIQTATNKVSSNSSSLSAVCNVVEKQIPIYGKNISFAGYVTNRELKEKTTYYYHERTRRLIRDEYCEDKTIYVWSYSPNDQTLINQGFRYNGKKELINN